MPNSEMESIPCTIMRGGTSKAVFFLKNHLPREGKARDAVLLSVFGSPDVRQIDGLGGADPLTSKTAIIAPSDREDADVSYTFGQVDILKAFVDYSSNCGNISSAVGPFCIEQGLVNAVEPITKVRIHNTNTDKVFVSEVPVLGGSPRVLGDYHINGVPGTGAQIKLNFAGTVGSKTGVLLPTGNPADLLDIEGFGRLRVSMVDAGSPMVFVLANDLELKGVEMPPEVDSNPELLELLEKIRCEASVTMGIAKDHIEARENIRAVPLIAFVSPPNGYAAYGTNAEVSGSSMNFVSRVMFMQVMHKAYSITATVCTGSAAVTPGTIVNEVSVFSRDDNIIRFGHPCGTIDIEMESQNGVITRAAVGRTARRIMEGHVFVQKEGTDT